MVSSTSSRLEEPGSCAIATHQPVAELAPLRGQGTAFGTSKSRGARLFFLLHMSLPQ